MLLVGTAYSELIGEPTSIKHIVERYGLPVPRGYAPKLPKEERPRYRRVHARFQNWVRSHESLRRRGLVEKPDDGPSRLTIAGWGAVEQLLKAQA